MNKNMFKRTMRELLPLFIIFTLSTIVLGLSIQALIGQVLKEEALRGETPSGQILNIFALFYVFAMGLILGTILPFNVFSYRFNHRKADTYLQLPFASGVLKRIRLLAGLIYLAIYVAVAYVVLEVVANFQQLSYAPSVFWGTDGFQPIYILFLFLLLILTALNYFLSSVPVSEGNNILNSIILLVATDTFLSCIILAPYTYCLINFARSSGALDGFVNAGLGALSSVQDFFFFITLLQATYSVPAGGQISPLFAGPLSWICFALHLALCAAAAVYLWKSAEPSGENAGKIPPAHNWARYIVHGAFLTYAMVPTVGSITTSAGLGFLSVVSFITQIVSFGVFYYVTMIIFNRTWKLTKKDLISAAIVMGTFVVLGIVGLAMSALPYKGTTVYIAFASSIL